MAGTELVLARWRDAWFDFDEPDPEDTREDYLVTTVGFLVRETPRFVSLAQELLPDGDGFRAVTHIPRAVLVGPLRALAVAVGPVGIQPKDIDADDVADNLGGLAARQELVAAD